MPVTLPWTGRCGPVYTTHNFALSFNTGKADDPDSILVVCNVTHGRHSKRYQIPMPADGKGARGNDVMTQTHATGSAVSYGMRYLLRMIFNISVGEHDDDGNLAGNRGPPTSSTCRASPTSRLKTCARS